MYYPAGPLGSVSQASCPGPVPRALLSRLSFRAVSLRVPRIASPKRKREEEGDFYQGAARSPRLPYPLWLSALLLPSYEGEGVVVSPPEARGIARGEFSPLGYAPNPRPPVLRLVFRSLAPQSPHGRQSCVCYRSLAPRIPARARPERVGYSVPEPSNLHRPRLSVLPLGLVTKYPRAHRDSLAETPQYGPQA